MPLLVVLLVGDLADRTKASGRTAIFCGAREQPRAVMRQSGFAQHVGQANVCPHVEGALKRAEDGQTKLENWRTGELKNWGTEELGN
jgi:hypothetical protein